MSNHVDIDRIKLKYLKKIWARMSCDEEERANFQNILDLYIDKIIDRE